MMKKINSKTSTPAGEVDFAEVGGGSDIGNNKPLPDFAVQNTATPARGEGLNLLNN